MAFKRPYKIQLQLTFSFDLPVSLTAQPGGLLIISQTYPLLSHPCAFAQMIFLIRTTFSSLSHCSRPSAFAISSKISFIFPTGNISSLLCTSRVYCELHCSHPVLYWHRIGIYLRIPLVSQQYLAHTVFNLFLDKSIYLNH